MVNLNICVHGYVVIMYSVGILHPKTDPQDDDITRHQFHISFGVFKNVCVYLNTNGNSYSEADRTLKIIRGWHGVFGLWLI